MLSAQFGVRVGGAGASAPVRDGTPRGRSLGKRGPHCGSTPAQSYQDEGKKGRSGPSESAGSCFLALVGFFWRHTLRGPGNPQTKGQEQRPEHCQGGVHRIENPRQWMKVLNP